MMSKFFLPVTNFMENLQVNSKQTLFAKRTSCKESPTPERCHLNFNITNKFRNQTTLFFKKERHSRFFFQQNSLFLWKIFLVFNELFFYGSLIFIENLRLLLILIKETFTCILYIYMFREKILWDTVIQSLQILSRLDTKCERFICQL